MSWKRSIAALPSELLGLSARAARYCAPHNRALYWLASSDPNYLLWLLRHKRPLVNQAAAPPRSREPLFSVLTPVHNTRADWLREAIDSVRNQTFGAWELIIVDDASTTPATLTVLADCTAGEPRITLLHNTANAGIAASTNRAARAARGQYLVLLDHDDTFYPDTLATFARAIAQRPDARLLYADEDRLTSTGLRELHDFKPAFSPSLLEMCNYILHPLCIHSELWQEAGGLRSRFDGSQDYDLLLRLVDDGTRPVHVPGILYSWRQGSTSMAGGALKPHIYQSGRHALRAHLARRGEQGCVVDDRASGAGNYRIRFQLPSRLRVLLVANVEPPNLPDGCEATRIKPPTGGIAALGEHKVARFDAVVWLTDDLESRDWSSALGELIGWCRRSDVGVVGGRLLTPNGRILHAGLSLAPGQYLRADFARRALHRTPAACRLRDCLALAPGALAMTGPKLAALLGTSPLPPMAWWAALCLAARDRDWRVVYTPFASFRSSRPPPLPDATTVKALLAHYAIDRDPFRNPFLTSTRWNDLRLPLQWPLLDRVVAALLNRTHRADPPP